METQERTLKQNFTEILQKFVDKDLSIGCIDEELIHKISWSGFMRVRKAIMNFTDNTDLRVKLDSGENYMVEIERWDNEVDIYCIPLKEYKERYGA